MPKRASMHTHLMGNLNPKRCARGKACNFLHFLNSCSVLPRLRQWWRARESLQMDPKACKWIQKPANGSKSLQMDPKACKWIQKPANVSFTGYICKACKCIAFGYICRLLDPFACLRRRRTGKELSLQMYPLSQW
jgi:hypothetical protein